MKVIPETGRGIKFDIYFIITPGFSGIRSIQ
jgi:hypothetical protein